MSSGIDTLMFDVDRHAEPAAMSDLPDVSALLLLCRAERARAGAGQASEWAEVAQTWRALGRPYPAAYAYWREAEAAASDRAEAGAERAARTAYRLAESLGALPLRDEVASLGRRAGLNVAANQADANPFRLTTREREVLGLLCAGMTNRAIANVLFISEKTASVHVSNILSKLGVPNRAEAAAKANRLRLLGEPAED